MKKFILLICLLSSIVFNHSFSWDTTAAKYMPLMVGNVWVYYGESHQQFYTGSSKIKIRVSGIIDTLGKRYYRLNQVNNIISGSGGGCIALPLLVRIDSVTMNICSAGSNCYSNELIIDSLNSQRNDTSVKCPNSYKICIDTSSFNIFNTSFPSKLFINERGNTSTRYLRTIGPSYFNWGEAGIWCFTNLRGCVINGNVFGDTSMIVGISQISTEIPEHYSLSQNYPNPFNPMTKLKFDVMSNVKSATGGQMSNVKLTVFDVLGKEIQVLVNQQLSPGTYEVDFDGSDLPSGMYYYRLQVEKFTETRKMVLVK
jgi:Secretion system C-terminal sorting domain